MELSDWLGIEIMADSPTKSFGFKIGPHGSAALPMLQGRDIVESRRH
jgi:hypothetical protein